MTLKFSEREVNAEPKTKQAIITVSAAVDVVNDGTSIENQARRAVGMQEIESRHLDGLELEEVVEVQDHE